MDTGHRTCSSAIASLFSTSGMAGYSKSQARYSEYGSVLGPGFDKKKKKASFCILKLMNALYCVIRKPIRI